MSTGLAPHRCALFVSLVLATSGCDFGPNRIEAAKTKEVATSAEGRPLRLGEINPIQGTRIVAVEVDEADDRSSGYSSGGARRQRNVLILDSGSGSQRRLLPDNKRIIVQWIIFGDEQEGYQPSAKVTLAGEKANQHPSFVALVDTGTEQQPRHDLLMGSFVTGRQSWIARNLDGFDRAWAMPDGRIGIILTERGRTTYRVYDPASLKPILSIPITV